MEDNLDPKSDGEAPEGCKKNVDEKATAINHQTETAANTGATATLSSKALKRCLSVPIPRSQPPSREVSPAPVFNIFAPRTTRRYSASYSPARGSAAGNAIGGNVGAAAGGGGQSSRCITPRISQLRQEECADGLTAREVNHEREVHSAIQISQSWEDLSLVAENWSCKSSEELTNPLQVVVGGVLGSGNGCSSPSPTNNRANLRLPYGLSPSPTRRSTFATRRSMSPIAIRPSQLGPVKRKFELDEGSGSSAWSSLYSQPPSKKMFCESRGSSPICQSPSGSVCPSPDSGTSTYDGRITPKLLISKLYTHNSTVMNQNTTNSACSSPMSASSYGGDLIDTAERPSAVGPHLCSSSSSSSSSSSIAASSVSNNSEPMSLGSLDEGISLNDKIVEDATLSATSMQQVMQDESTLMDIIKPQTTALDECTKMMV